MSVTDELREWGRATLADTSLLVRMEAIADRIDAEHERAMADAYLIGTPTDEKLTEHGWVRKDKEHIISHATIEVTPHIDWSRMADELNEFVEIVRGMLIVGHSSTRTNGLKLRRTQMQFTDEQQRFIDEHYQLLPKDADGEYIRVGERVQLIGNDPSTVSHMSLADDGWRVYVKYDGGIGTGSGEPKRIRHYHAPTVEDVLREFALKVAGKECMTMRSDLVDEYAAKLQLKEGA